jgi:hypothetical protein
VVKIWGKSIPKFHAVMPDYGGRVRGQHDVWRLEVYVSLCVDTFRQLIASTHADNDEPLSDTHCMIDYPDVELHRRGHGTETLFSIDVARPRAAHIVRASFNCGRRLPATDANFLL